jgi:hypothetical protein
MTGPEGGKSAMDLIGMETTENMIHIHKKSIPVCGFVAVACRHWQPWPKGCSGRI